MSTDPTWPVCISVGAAADCSARPKKRMPVPVSVRLVEVSKNSDDNDTGSQLAIKFFILHIYIDIYIHTFVPPEALLIGVLMASRALL